MRASKKQPSLPDMHISGAEGIYADSDLTKIVKSYIQRALTHPRGGPDSIVITLERLQEASAVAALLPVSTLRLHSPLETRNSISGMAATSGISVKALAQAWKVLLSPHAMRGAALVRAESGRRAEPDRKRGVRVSRLGLDDATTKELSRRLSRLRINTSTVREALVLASKVASCPGIVAELCISDDPDYTTGYFSSPETGYVRLPHIKKKDEMHGGRVFFIRDDAESSDIIVYLEKEPVIISAYSAAVFGKEKGAGAIPVKLMRGRRK